jgi:hypothetical protein
MRGLRSTLVLLLVLAGLGAYIYFVTWQQPDPAQSTQNRVYQGLTGDDIVEFTLRAESGEVTTVRKTGDTWQIVAPRVLPSSFAQVNGLTSMLAYLDVVRVIEEDPKNLAEYGLDKPRISIDFKVADGRALGTLLIGNKSPTGANMYAKRADEKRVFLVGQHHEASLSRTTFDLREKKIASFLRDDVTALDVTRGKERLAFKKDGGRWIMTSPVSARADIPAVDALVGSIEVAQMRSVLTDDEPTSKELRTYGLEPPNVKVIVEAPDGKGITLLVGNAVGADAFYAKTANAATVFTVEKVLDDELKKAAADFRRKEIFDFQTPTATRVEITRNGQTFAVERLRGQGEGGQDTWRRVAPATGEVDKTKFEALLSDLTAIQATAFTPTTANTGLRTPVMSVLVKYEDGKREDSVAFGRNGADAYASRTDEPGAARIPASSLEKVIAAVDALAK